MEDILADVEVLVTPQRQVYLLTWQATSMSIMLGRPTDYHEEWTPETGASWVPSFRQGQVMHLRLQKISFRKALATVFRWKPQNLKKNMAAKGGKLKGGYSSDTSLVFQSWLKDIWVYVLGHHLSQQEVIQLVKDYTSELALLKVEYYLGLTPNSKQSFQGHISIM